jgi:diguanylate cyclase (GGDEF)-like protein
MDSTRGAVVLGASSVVLLVSDAFAAGLAARGGLPGGWPAVAAAAALGVLVARIAVVSVREERRRDAALRRAARELDELLETSASSQESQQLLLGHAQRVVPGAGTGILVVAENGDSIEPVLTNDVDQTPLRGIRTAGARTRSCLSMRLSRSYSRTPDEPVLTVCEVCGSLDADVACEPLIAGGETIGSVLVVHERHIEPAQSAALRAAASRAAPILARQRELADTEERAVTDGLTGLPNRRAAEETIRRMVAHAGRALSPLGIVLLDLDRFRVLNTLHGHSHGDKALAGLGRLLATTVRASDFAARWGGEEFLLLLPDTDRQGSIEVAEKLRLQIERTELVQTGPITASFGIACLPEDAVDPEQLLRQADRALYMAKVHGRNRVEAAGLSD